MKLTMKLTSLLLALVLALTVLMPVAVRADGFDDFGGGNYPMPPGYDLPGVQQMAQSFYYIGVAGAGAFLGFIGAYEVYNWWTAPVSYDFGGGGSW